MSENDQKSMDLTQAEVVKTLRDARFVMLTTALSDGRLVSHPMVPQEVTDDADVWFFVGLAGDQAEALKAGANVNIAVSEAGSWLSVAGKAAFVDDAAKVEELWNDEVEAYDTSGAGLGLLKVTGESAQFWGMPGGKVRALAEMLKSRVEGERPAGESGTTTL